MGVPRRVMDTLAGEAGWDPHSASLLLGTSAGAAVAAGVRGGATAGEIIARVTRGPTQEERERYQEQMANRQRSFRPVAPSLVRHVWRGRRGIAVAFGGLLPTGWFPTEPLGEFPGLNGDRTWPKGLWIPAVRLSDGELVVFGRDRTDLTVREAVEASSAVPALFRPKRIGDERFVDGGLPSPTHADIAADCDPDLVIVSSPMTRPGRRPLRILARRHLANERSVLARRGIPAIVIEPPEGSADVFKGYPRRNPAAAPRILELAAAATRGALAGAQVTPV